LKRLLEDDLKRLFENLRSGVMSTILKMRER